MLLSGTGSAAGPLDGKNTDASIPRYLMEPKWAAREGSEAAAHSLAQPFLVPLEANGMPVASADVTPLGEYAPKTPQYTNPLAQFIPNVTYVANGDEVVGFEGADDVAEEDEAAEGGDAVKSTLRSTEGNKWSKLSRLEMAEAKEDALLKEHSNAALQIRQRIAQLRGSNRQALQASVGATLRPARIISPVYGAPMEVTAGAVQAMKQADLINQANLMGPRTAQVQVTYK